MKYTIEELEERIEEMNKGGIVLSVQYGMVFILSSNNEILLNLSDLVKKKERRKA